MKNYLRNALEEIDSVVFTGDDLQDPETLTEFREYIARWLRELDQKPDLEDTVLNSHSDVDTMSPSQLLRAISHALKEMK